MSDKELFYKFLVDEGVLFMFMKNIEISLEELFKEADGEMFISGSFLYWATPEGDKFWNDLNIKWRKQLLANQQKNERTVL